LMENFTFIKNYGAEKFIKEFLNEGWGLWDDQTFGKAARN